MTLPDYLKQLQSEGRADSQGRFTLDPARALEKRMKHLLNDPTLYGLKFVQAAVRSQARSIDVQAQGRTIALHHGGQAMKLSEVDSSELGDDLMSSFFGAESLAARVELVVTGAEEAFRLTLEKGNLSWSTAPTGPVPNTSLIIERPKGSLWSRLWRRSEPELDLIQERATFCPIPITINSTPMDRGVMPKRLKDWKGFGVYRNPEDRFDSERSPAFVLQPGRFFAEARQSGQVGPYLLRSDALRHFTVSESGQLEPLPTNFPPGCYRGRIGFVADLEEPRLILVLQGVSIVCEMLRKKPGFVCVWSAEDLKSDLTGLDVVRDAAFDKMVDHLSNVATHLWDDVIGQGGHAITEINELALRNRDSTS